MILVTHNGFGILASVASPRFASILPFIKLVLIRCVRFLIFVLTLSRIWTQQARTHASNIRVSRAEARVSAWQDKCLMEKTFANDETYLQAEQRRRVATCALYSWGRN